jgi:ADP-dependent NAD(P)H-hydrate dehydratase / NAD(P)H-hydrate epimerase
MDGTGSRFYSAAQVRELDRAAIASGIPGYTLMQRAAVVCWRELTRRWPKARTLAVLCGPGNNGGDGYEIARLARAAGWTVSLWQVGSVPASGDAATAHAAWLADSGEVHAWTRGRIESTDVIVDALLGTGLARAPDADLRDAILAINAARDHGAGVLAVDVPSGLDVERGMAPGEAVRADLTVTFIGRKPGLHLADGPDHAGTVVFDALQVPAGVLAKLDFSALALTPEFLPQVLPRRARTAHKGRHGHVLLVGGDAGMAGAILLAARGALRAGAGLVSVATRPAHAAALAAAQPEVMAHGIEQARDLHPLLQRATVVAIGPGLGRGDWGRELWAKVTAVSQPLVVDADALNWLAENPQQRDDWVLTPHPGEAARLLACTNTQVQDDRFAAARELQSRFGGCVVLKGAGTLVQGQGTALCPYGNPGMGTGGMGDVLCGLIAGLMAQGLAPETAARAGVLAHALAADRAAERGERGLLPSDVLAQLRPLLNS